MRSRYLRSVTGGDQTIGYVPESLSFRVNNIQSCRAYTSLESPGFMMKGCIDAWGRVEVYCILMFTRGIHAIEHQPVFSIHEQQIARVRCRVRQPPVPIVAALKVSKPRVIVPTVHGAVRDVFPLERSGRDRR